MIRPSCSSTLFFFLNYCNIIRGLKSASSLLYRVVLEIFQRNLETSENPQENVHSDKKLIKAVKILTAFQEEGIL